ncbi:MAG TPA: alpha-ketoacid dehydrogenase subunit beta [Candidatus Dormibacteraeota bacterium]|nr:alpha-ketoacid dehydrogenase subunit beta [Candidatus Dormibacteraeota bacterium]
MTAVAAPTRTVTIRDALRETLRAEMQRDPRVVLLGEDIGAYGGSYAVTRGLVDEFGSERVRDTPIAESAIVGAAVGAAMGGLRPVAELMTTNFALVAIDQIVNHAAKLRHMFGDQFGAPVVIRMVNGWGQLAATHSQSFDAWFAHVPGLHVVAPSNPADAAGLLRNAMRGEDPVVFIEHSRQYAQKGEAADDPDHVVPFGRARLVRPGRDVTLVAWSYCVPMAEAAADRLAKDGIEAEVLDLRSLRPLDREALVESVRRTHRVVCVEESWRSFGVGAEVAATLQDLAFDELDAPVGRVAAREVPMPYSKPLEAACLPAVDDVVAAVRAQIS